MIVALTRWRAWSPTTRWPRGSAAHFDRRAPAELTNLALSLSLYIYISIYLSLSICIYIYIHTYKYIYNYIYTSLSLSELSQTSGWWLFILFLKLDKQLPVEQFEASRAIRGSSISVSSTLSPLNSARTSDSAARANPQTNNLDFRGLTQTYLYM